MRFQDISAKSFVVFDMGNQDFIESNPNSSAATSKTSSTKSASSVQSKKVVKHAADKNNSKKTPYVSGPYFHQAFNARI